VQLVIEDESIVREYYGLRQSLDQYTKDMRDVINHPNYCLQFMQPGRLVKIKHQSFDFGWGAVVNYSKRHNKGGPEGSPPQQSYIIDILLNVSPDAAITMKFDKELPAGVRPPAEGEEGKMEVVPVLLSCLESISPVRIFLPKDMKSQDQRNTARKNIREVKKRFPDGIPTLDPIENMNITDDSFKKLLRVSFLLILWRALKLILSPQKIELHESKLLANPLHNSPRLVDLYNKYSYKVVLSARIKAVKKKIQTAHSIMQLDELKCRKRVLRRLGFISENDVMQLKARVACEISTGDELLLTELLFNRVFNELTPEQTAALLSCFVFEEKSNETPSLKEELAKPFRDLQAQARLIAKISQESKLNIVEEEYIDKFKHALMDVVYAWCHGASFATIW